MTLRVQIISYCYTNFTGYYLYRKYACPICRAVTVSKPVTTPAGVQCEHTSSTSIRVISPEEIWTGSIQVRLDDFTYRFTMGKK